MPKYTWVVLTRGEAMKRLQRYRAWTPEGREALAEVRPDIASNLGPTVLEPRDVLGLATRRRQVEHFWGAGTKEAWTLAEFRALEGFALAVPDYFDVAGWGRPVPVRNVDGPYRRPRGRPARRHEARACGFAIGDAQMLEFQRRLHAWQDELHVRHPETPRLQLARGFWVLDVSSPVTGAGDTEHERAFYTALEQGLRMAHVPGLDLDEVKNEFWVKPPTAGVVYRDGAGAYHFDPKAFRDAIVSARRGLRARKAVDHDLTALPGQDNVVETVEAADALAAVQAAIAARQSLPAGRSEARRHVRENLSQLLSKQLSSRELAEREGIDRRAIDRALEEEREAIRAAVGAA